MERHQSTSPTAHTRHFAGDHPWLGALIEKIDKVLRRRNGVIEYTQSRDCFCRMQLIRNSDDLLLSDGTCLRPGDRLINLHFWSEQIPLLPAKGPTFGWARRMIEIFESSLQELANHLVARTDVDDVAAIRVSIALGTAARSDQVSRVLSRFGFEAVPRQDTPSIAERARRYRENVLITFLVIARNTIALRADTLRRDRVAAYLSRRALEQRYGYRQKRNSNSQ